MCSLQAAACWLAQAGESGSAELRSYLEVLLSVPEDLCLRLQMFRWYIDLFRQWESC